VNTEPTVREDLAIEVTEADIWRSLLTKRRLEALDGAVAHAREEALALATPKVIYRHIPVVETGAGRVALEGGLAIENAEMAPYFSGADTAVAMVLTIGPAVEERVQQLFSRDKFMEAMVLDAAASAMVSATFRRGHLLLHEQVAQWGWETGPCLRPGSTYWDIQGQRLIFGAVPAERIGVRLLDSCFMLPRKTQSTIMPAGKELVVRANPTDSYCRLCRVPKCLARRMQ
jgi:hypothetical protein